MFAYVPAVPGGDPMACTSAANCPSPGAVGYVDGYSMPGTMGATILYDSGQQNGGALAGADRFEVAFPWTALGVAPGTPIFWHVAASPNASFNPAVDNAGGPDGKLGTFGVFAVSFTPDRSGATASPGTVDYCHTVENTGQFSDSYNLSGISSSGAGMALYAADAACVRGALLAVDANGNGTFSDPGDTAPSAANDTNSDGIPDTGTLAAGATRKVIVQLRVPAGRTNSSDRLRTTATSTRRSDVFGTVVDTTAIGGVTVFPNLTASGTPGLTVLVGPHRVQNNLTAADDYDLRVVSASGWKVSLYADAAGAPAALLGTDTNGDGTWDGVAPTTGTLAGGAQRAYWLRATIAAGATVGSTHLVTLRATSRTNPTTWGEAFDVLTVAPALQLLPSYLASSNTALVGAPGGLVYLPHRLVNSRDVVETVSLSQTAPPVAGYTIRWFTDPDGDGNFSDGAQITGSLTVPPFGGVVNLITEISVPTSGTPAAFPAVTTATGTGSSASAGDNVTVGQLATFRDPLYTQADRYFPACGRIYAQAHGLSANQTSTYQLQYVNPLGVVTAAQNLPTDTSGNGRVSLALGAADAPGNWTLRLRQGATLLRELTPVVVERSGTVQALAPATAQDGQLLAVAAQLNNTASQSGYTDTRVDFELRDPLGNLFRSSAFTPLEVAYQASEVASTSWSNVTFPSFGTYTLTVTWSTPCGSVIATGSTPIVAAPEAPLLTSPAHNSGLTTATPTLQGTARSGALVSVYVDGVLVGTSSGPNFSVLPATLSQGAHTWYATQTVSGTTSPASVAFAFTVDSVAPDTSISSGPAQGSITRLTTASFGFGSDDPAASFACSLDGAAYSPCTSPVAYSGLGEGGHSFAVRATDPFGNTDASPATRSWSVDLTPPETLVTGPASPSNSASASFTFSSPDGISFECSLDGEAYAACTPPVLRTGLTEGSHRFEVRALDVAGNVDPTPARHDWTVDLTPPQTVVSGPASPTASQVATLTFSSPDGVGFECSLDGASFAPCSSPTGYSGLAEGPHTFTVRAIDLAGNVDPTPAQHAWTVDLTPPQTVVSGPSSPTNATSAVLTFSSPDGVAFECSLNGAAFTSCTSPASFSGLTDGAYTFAVRAIDAVGNVDPTAAQHGWTVDTLPPDTSVAGPASPSNSSSATLTFGSPEGGVTFQCSLDGAVFASCSSPLSLTSLSQGSHTFRVRAVDAAANVDPTPAQHGWVVDLTPPDTTLSGPPPLTNLNTATLSFVADEPATFVCNLDGAAAAACTSPVNLTGLADGPHTFTVRATDLAGNLEVAAASHGWTVDTTPPQTTLTGFPPAVDSSTTPSFSFTSSAAGSTFECSLDGAVFTACTSPRGYSGLVDGPHTFAVRATDPATNTDPTPAQYSWTVDSNIPDTSLDAVPPLFSPSPLASFEFSSTGVSPTFYCSLDGAPFSVCTSPLDLAGLIDGEHSFAVYSVSGAGTTDPDPAMYQWTVDTVAPDTFVSGPASPSSSPGASLVFSSNESQVSFQCRLDGAAYTACVSPLGLTSLIDGPHLFEVFAIDAAGQVDSSPASHAWTVDTQAPDTVVAGPASPTAATSAVFTFSSPDDAGASFECSLDGAVYAGCASPLTVNGLGEGSHTFHVRGYDLAGNRDPSPAVHAWTVDLTPPQTVVSGPASPSGAISAVFTFSSPDDAGASFECSLDGESFEVCVSPETRTGLGEGPHSFAVRAVDAVGNPDPTPAEHAWEVDLTPPQTTVSGPASPSAVAWATFTFAGEESTDTFECSLDGAAFAGCTSPVGVLGLDEGPHTFAVRATDQAGNTDPTPAAHGWVIDLTPPQTFVAGPGSPTLQTSADFTFTSDDAAASFRCALDGATYAVCAADHARSGLGEGPHTLRVAAVDAAGNTDPTPAEHTWVVDLTPPDTTLDGPAALTNDPDAQLTFSADEPASFECSLNGVAPSPCTSPISFPSLADGVYQLEVRATDTAGNVEPVAAVHAWTVDTTPPDTQLVAQPAAIDAASSARFEFASADPDTAGYQCSVDGAAFGACASPLDLTGLTDAPHTFSVRAVDAAGNVDASPAGYAWRVDTSIPDTAFVQAPPAFSSSTDASFGFGSTASPATFQCAVDGAAFAPCAATLNLTGLADGPHRVDVRSLNEAGTVDPSPATHAWTVDTLPPDTTLVGPPVLTRSTGASFTFDASETGVTFECSLDGAGWVVCASPVAFTGISEGAHTLAVRSTDRAGNVEAIPAQHPWTIDLTAPDTGIAGPPAQLASSSAELVFTATEGGVVFECSVDGSTFDPCDATLSLTGLSEGQHTVQVRATDAVGNTDATPAIHTWNADLTAPDTSVLSGPAALVNTRAAELEFGTDDPAAVFECSVDGGSFGACGASLALSDLADGSHRVEVRARDAAGNVDGSPAVHTWTVDTVAPDTVLELTPEAQDRYREASWEFQSTEPGSTLLCRLDAADWAPCTSPLTLTDLSEGDHVFEVMSVDLAGNPDSTPARFEWNIRVDLRFVGGGCGCGTSQGSAFSFLGAFVLVGLLRRRRR
ncbi:MAG: Ig-like domain repeat protein [Myxococcota bacterium]|nr:Ig-like domain repeat protein [Myxococcota bacterium]